MKNFIYLVIFSAAAGVPGISAQDDVVTPNRVRQPITIEQVRERDFDRRRREMARISNLSRERSIELAKPLTREEREKFEQATEPSPEDVKAFEQILKQSNTGIFRLLPDFDCEKDKLVTVAGPCADFVPGSWAYSFRSDRYSGKDFHDIVFKRGEFITRGLLTQGILVSLGDKPIEGVRTDTPGIRFLVDFVPGESRPEAAKQYQDFTAGVKEGEFRYSNRVDVSVGTTYGLRVVAYRFSDKWTSRLWPRNSELLNQEEAVFRLLDVDKRNDSIFVFRVIRKSEDGGVTIVWKRLAKEKSPKMVYEESERLRDFREF